MMKKAAMLLASATAVAGCSDINSDGTVDVNDLLGVLSGFGGAGADGEDINGDGTVDGERREGRALSTSLSVPKTKSLPAARPPRPISQPLTTCASSRLLQSTTCSASSPTLAATSTCSSACPAAVTYYCPAPSPAHSRAFYMF